ncbi:MAG: endonuclease/exonuclease/phosphatase family protein, partial [Mangrovicoccus sp.]|nr:endonuclease/exonuclease/phosphatase family protein [Mangrovicoccus sp.]
MEKRLAWIAALMLSPLLGIAALAQEPSQLRIATYNAALNRESAGALIADLEGRQDAQAQKIAQIIQWIRPDILLLNEIDQDQESRAAQIFHEHYLNQGQAGGDPIHYPYIYMPPVNTGIDSGFDLDGDGRLGGPGDAWGYGAFPGQYGFAVFSRLPLD